MYGLKSRESLSKKHSKWSRTTVDNKSVDNIKSVSEEKIDFSESSTEDKEISKISDLLIYQKKIDNNLLQIDNKLNDIIKYLSKRSIGKNEYIPFYVKEEFTCCNNKTMLNERSVDMIVDILGNIGNTIYPFGNEIIEMSFPEQNIVLKYKDCEMIEYDDVHGKLRLKNNIYLIELTDFFSNKEKIKFKDLSFPVTICYNGTFD